MKHNSRKKQLHRQLQASIIKAVRLYSWSVLLVDVCNDTYAIVKRKPARTISTGIGIAWGIFVLVVLTGVGAGFERGVLKMFGGFSQNTTYVYALETSTEHSGSLVRKKIVFTEEDLRLLRSSIPQITYMSPQVTHWDRVFNGLTNSMFEIKAVYADYFNIHLLKAKSGRLLNNSDISGRARTILIGEDMEKMLFKNRQAIGAYVRINKELHRVVGIVEKSLLNAQDSRSVYMPYTTYLQSYPSSEEFTTVLFSFQGNADIVYSMLRRLMAQKYRFNYNDEKALLFNGMEWKNV